MPTFTELLRIASETTQSLLCVGLDPDPARLPVADAAEFNRAIVSATADLVCAYKPNLAFYEALGLPGFKALEKTVQHIRDAAPHCIIIGDCKRGDIDSSAAAYTTAMFGVWGFDAATVNPWGGMDTVEPWLTNPEKGAFIWCRGSNRGAADIQDLAVSGVGNLNQPLYLRLARRSQQRAVPGQPRPGRRRHRLRSSWPMSAVYVLICPSSSPASEPRVATWPIPSGAAWTRVVVWPSSMRPVP